MALRGLPELDGTAASHAALDGAARARAAVPIALHLRALHAIPARDALEAGAGPDPVGKLEVARLRPRLEERFGELVRRRLVADPRPWVAIAEEALSCRAPLATTLVHGDFDARHLLLDRDGAPAGVIDWGDTHIGDPAVDLAIAHGFLPPGARGPFREAYGPIDAQTWALARFRACFTTAAVLVYGLDLGDGPLVAEGRAALENLREP